MPRERLLRPLPVVALLTLAVGGVVVAARTPRPAGMRSLTEDERDYVVAAANLSRAATLSFVAPGQAAPPPGAYREPGYPLLLALEWRLLGAPVPADAVEVDRFLETPSLRDATRALNVALLVVAVAAVGWAAARVGGATAGALAAALVASSPALHDRVRLVMSENLAGAHLALLAASLVAWARGSRSGALASALLLALLPLTRSEGVVLAAAAATSAAILFVAALRRRGAGRARAGRALLFGLWVLLPALLWAGRNARELGHLTLGDRSGLALAVRAGIDAEIARTGALPAALAWTPSEAARRWARRLAPEGDYLDYRRKGPGNFYTRPFLRWEAERARAGADPLEVDAALGRESLRSFVAHPRAHLAAVPAVAWRGLFAELSPAWAWPFDLRVLLGLLLACGVAFATARGLAGRDVALLALLAPAWILFAFHALATEFLPRYGAPLLPIAWAAAALGVAGRRRPATPAPD